MRPKPSTCGRSRAGARAPSTAIASSARSARPAIPPGSATDSSPDRATSPSPNWGGEYGFWDTEPDTLAVALRYAADEDAHLWGGAWWQWRQSCGDPHHVQWSGGTVVAPAGESTHLNRLDCPGNGDLGPNDDFLSILGRGYPRAAPGRLTSVTSDVGTGRMRVEATATAAGGELVVWAPTVDDADLRVTVDGLTDVVEHAVDGGRIITATVAEAGAYWLQVGPGAADPDEPDDDPDRPSTPPATPIRTDADFTG